MRESSFSSSIANISDAERLASALGGALLDRIESGELDPSFVITHRVPLDQAPDAYKLFRDHEEGCIKVVLKPHPETVH